MELKVRFTTPKCCEDRVVPQRPSGALQAGGRPKADSAKLDPRWSQAVPMPLYTIPESSPAQIHAKGAAWVAFHRCENAVKTHLRTHPPVRPGGSSPPRVNTAHDSISHLVNFNPFP